MFSFAGRCPHCSSDRGFLAFGLSHYLIGEYDYSKNPLQEKGILMRKREDNPLTEFSLAGTCMQCQKPVVASCRASLKQREEIVACIGNFGRTVIHRVEVTAVFPTPMPPYSHPSLPENVRATFIDLQRMIRDNMQPHLIIMGCRAVLEAAVRSLGANGKNLYDSIEDLRENGVITESLKEWGTIVRRVGNDAAHEMKGTREDANEMVEFIKVFLQFTFELPSIIKSKKT